MFNNITKIAFIVIIVSMLFNVWQHFNISSLETSLSREKEVVTSLERDVARLENNEKINAAVCISEQEALKERLTKTEEIRESVSNAKDSLDKIRRKEKANEETKDADGSSNYHRDIARVLNDTCREIFGQDCPSPK